MSDKGGGQRNRKKPDVDREHLRDVVDAYVRKMGTSNAFDFSPYGESLGKQCACSAKGLVKAKEFLKVLNKANPDEVQCGERNLGGSRQEVARLEEEHTPRKATVLVDRES